MGVPLLYLCDRPKSNVSRDAPPLDGTPCPWKPSIAERAWAWTGGEEQATEEQWLTTPATAADGSGSLGTVTSWHKELRRVSKCAA